MDSDNYVYLECFPHFFCSHLSIANAFLFINRTVEPNALRSPLSTCN